MSLFSFFQDKEGIGRPKSGKNSGSLRQTAYPELRLISPTSRPYTSFY